MIRLLKMLFLSYRLIHISDIFLVHRLKSKKECYFIHFNFLGNCKSETRKKRQKEQAGIEALSLLFEFLMLPTHGRLKSD